MVAEVHQTLCYIRFGNTDCVELSAVQNQFMTYPAVMSGINNTIGITQLGCNVICTENSSCRCFTQPFATHHADISIRYKRHICIAKQRRRDTVIVLRRHTIHQMFSAANSTDTRSATSVRRSKRLMQIQVAYVRTDETRTGITNLRIHIRSVHIHLSAILVNNIAHLANRHLKYSVRRRICYHTSC